MSYCAMPLQLTFTGENIRLNKEVLLGSFRGCTGTNLLEILRQIIWQLGGPSLLLMPGYAQDGKNSASKNVLLNDMERVDYLSSYLTSLSAAIRKGADVRGYFIWSLIDNFEWVNGYTLRFGLYHVDCNTLERTPKLSAQWYKQFLSSPKMPKHIGGSDWR